MEHKPESEATIPEDPSREDEWQSFEELRPLLELDGAHRAELTDGWS